MFIKYNIIYSWCIIQIVLEFVKTVKEENFDVYVINTIFSNNNLKNNLEKYKDFFFFFCSV